jgi:hypothetical protein
VTEQLQLCEWGHFLLEKGNRCSEITCGSWMHLISTPCINFGMKHNNRTNRMPRYCCPNHNRTFPRLVFHCLIGCSQNVTSWYREPREGRQFIWPHHDFPVVWCPDFMVVIPSFTYLNITFSNQRFSNCSRTHRDVGFVKLTSHSFCGKRAFKVQECSVLLSFVLQYFCDFWKRSLSLHNDLVLSVFSSPIFHSLDPCMPTI